MNRRVKKGIIGVRRRCIGCMNSFDKSQLIRIAENEDDLIVDLEKKLHSRGVYVCKNDSCLCRAIQRKAFQRSFKKGFSDEKLKILKNDIISLLPKGKIEEEKDSI